MTTIEREHIDRIERDRRKRERVLLGAMLAFAGRAFAQAKRAIRVGADAVKSAVDAILGREAVAAPAHVHWRGLADVAVPILNETYVAGIVRATQIAGVRLDRDELVPVVTPPTVAEVSAQLEQKTADAVARVVGEAVAEGAASEYTAAKIARILGETATAAGMTADRPEALQIGAERAVCTAYNGGMFEGFEHKSLLGRVTGFRYVAVLDDVTTTTCRTYNGVKLPKGHPWLLNHWPPCHWNCRSVCLPLFGAFEPTAEPPYFPEPPAGFGQAPILAYGTLIGR